MGYYFFGKWKWSRLKIILCSIFYRNETTVVPKKSLEKLEISIEATVKFIVNIFWKNILQDLLPDDTWKINFRMPKGHFEALFAELRPYISPNLSSPNHRALGWFWWKKPKQGHEKIFFTTFKFVTTSFFNLKTQPIGAWKLQCAQFLRTQF